MFPEIEPCDLLLIAGDVCPVDQSHEAHFQMNWIRGEFMDWISEQPAKDIVWIGGNHDFCCELPTFRDSIESISPHFVHYLKDEVVLVQNKVIYGTPWTPNLTNWAFYASPKAWQWIAEAVPGYTDILVMHAPPSGIMLDGGHPEWGAPEMLTEIRKRVKPELCVFGHVHEGYGQLDALGTQYANVAHVDEFYEPINSPMVFELPAC